MRGAVCEKCVRCVCNNHLFHVSYKVACAFLIWWCVLRVCVCEWKCCLLVFTSCVRYERVSCVCMRCVEWKCEII